jgi:hypothetical protein
MPLSSSTCAQALAERGTNHPRGNDVLIKCPLFQTLWDVAMQQLSKRKLPIIPTAQFPEEGVDEGRVNNAVVNETPKKVQTLAVGS